VPAPYASSAHTSISPNRCRRTAPSRRAAAASPASTVRSSGVALVVHEVRQLHHVDRADVTSDSTFPWRPSRNRHFPRRQSAAASSSSDADPRGSDLARRARERGTSSLRHVRGLTLAKTSRFLQSTLEAVRARPTGCRVPVSSLAVCIPARSVLRSSRSQLFRRA